MAKHGSIQHPLYSVSEVWWCILTIADLLMLETHVGHDPQQKTGRAVAVSSHQDGPRD